MLQLSYSQVAVYKSYKDHHVYTSYNHRFIPGWITPLHVFPTFNTDLVVFLLISHYHYVITTAKGEQQDDCSSLLFPSKEKEEKYTPFGVYSLTSLDLCNILQEQEESGESWMCLNRRDLEEWT